MKRSKIKLTQIAEQKTLYFSFWRAARGKRDRQEVREFSERLDSNLATLAGEILDGSVRVGDLREFMIYDPKPRLIHAPCFRERVLHHALMVHVGPELERMAVFDSYACRKHKGTIKAIQRAQHHSCRFPWYVQIDIRKYFRSIRHDILKIPLRRRFKDRALLHLLDKIIDAYQDTPGCGFSICALTSQYFANHYLDAFDRFLLEDCKVAAIVRYMDDVVWWCHEKLHAKDVLDQAAEFLKAKRALAIKPTFKLQRSLAGLNLCGFRVFPGCIRLGKRRQRLYKQAWLRLEKMYGQGMISEQQLQLGYDSSKSLIQHVDSAAWRRVLHRNDSLVDTWE